MPNKTSSNNISEPNDLTFVSKQYKQTLESHKHILSAYKKNIEKITKLKGDLPIFLDTSVILSAYEISFVARDKIKHFLSTNKDRIVLTGQVQFEFIKNREKVINSFQEDVTEQLPRDFNTDVVVRLSSFISANKAKLEDYAEILNKLTALQLTASELHKLIQENVNDKKGTAKSLLYEDEFLNILSNVSLLDNLEPEYSKLIKEEYKSNIPNFKSTASETYTLNCFPGCGEKGEKDDPSGDYVIYHEMMKYALDNKKDIIFLTNDTKKGDWIRKDGKPHLHYIENFYLNTGQIIYILNAERVFENLFNTSFESLITEKNESQSLIDTNELSSFLDGLDIFENLRNPKVGQLKSFSTELYKNKIYDIKTLAEKSKFASLAMSEVIKFMSNLTKSGALRICLDLIHRDYKRMPWGESAEAKIKKLTIHWEENFGFIF